MKKVNCILLVDDNEHDNFIHKRTILKSGICDLVEIAPNGEDALDYLKKCSEGAFQRPDIIFLDINMPGMNGFEFLEEYTKLDSSMKSKIVVFMLTSSLMPEDAEKARSTGEVSDFLNKPLTAETVLALVDKYL